MSRSPIITVAFFVSGCCYFTAAAAQDRPESPPGSNHQLVGWQDNPGRRGSLNILMNCAFTVLSCTWSIQHLNLPDPKDCFCRKLLRKSKWMLLTILLPELILAHAVLEFIMAVNSTKDMGGVDGVFVHYPWWLFKRQTQTKRDNDFEWTLTHSYYANMGGFHPCKSISECQTIHPLTTGQLAKLWTNINPPKISENEIKEKGDADFFAKGVAVMQISSLVLSIIVRATQHLAFSQLELLTLAFAVCGVLTYAFCWYKPRGIQTATIVYFSDSQPVNELTSSLNPAYDRVWTILTNDAKQMKDLRIPNDNIPKRGDNTHEILFLLAGVSVMFGGLHFIAWDFEFPTQIEKIYWRVAAAVTVTLPPLTLLAIPLSQIVVRWDDPHDFMATLMYALREYSYAASDNELARHFYGEVEKIYNSAEETKEYGDIFNSVEAKALGRQLLKFVERERASLKFPKQFSHQFNLLLDIMDEKIELKSLRESGKTDLFPKKVLLPRSINLSILYATGILYCLARLSIIALALSSFRAMPDSVYWTTWAKVLPNVQ
jgi:hypothetical protein